jgi:hypothetical protein
VSDVFLGMHPPIGRGSAHPAGGWRAGGGEPRQRANRRAHTLRAAGSLAPRRYKIHTPPRLARACLQRAPGGTHKARYDNELMCSHEISTGRSRRRCREMDCTSYQHAAPLWCSTPLPPRRYSTPLRARVAHGRAVDGRNRVARTVAGRGVAGACEPRGGYGPTGALVAPEQRSQRHPPADPRSRSTGDKSQCCAPKRGTGVVHLHRNRAAVYIPRFAQAFTG